MTNDPHKRDDQPEQFDDREIPVFVSSTFRDMHGEREVLTKRVCPQLRKLCEERGVAFTEVDLRWGVNDEQKAEGKVLPICLAEIDRCRPFFIGLLGERYGWVPDEDDIPRELMDQQSWLKEHKDRSVTELEVLHGVLRNPVMANRASFYFRDPEYVNPPDAPQRLGTRFCDRTGGAWLLYRMTSLIAALPRYDVISCALC